MSDQLDMYKNDVGPGWLPLIEVLDKQLTTFDMHDHIWTYTMGSEYHCSECGVTVSDPDDHEIPTTRRDTMTITDLVFEEPPPSARTGPKAGGTSVHVTRLEAVIARPGEWARWPTLGSAQGLIRKAERNWPTDLGGTFEITARTVGKSPKGWPIVQTWVRFVPTSTQADD